jgi:hypothetical protein
MAGEVSRDVDCVRNNQKPHRNQHEWQRIELLGVGGDALACDTPDMRADELDSDHERRREKHRPQQAVAKLGTSLRIGRDSGWIVICRTSDKTGTEQTKNDVRLFGGRSCVLA